MSPRSQARALARPHDLGEIRGVHRERRPVWTGRARYAMLLACVLALPCAFRDPLPATVLVAGAVIGVCGYANLAEITTPVGRRWIAVFDGGLVVLAEFADPIVLRWNAITQTLRVPRRLGHAAGTRGVSWTRTVFYEAYQFSGRDTADRRVTVPVGAFTGWHRLVDFIEAKVYPFALFRARRALSAGGRASFGPVAVTRTGLEVTVGEALFTVPWSKFRADGERIVPLLPGALNTHPQLAAIPVNRALLALVAELREGRAGARDGR